jgi:hypothetical protein
MPPSLNLIPDIPGPDIRDIPDIGVPWVPRGRGPSTPWPRPARVTVAAAPSRDAHKARTVGQRPGQTRKSPIPVPPIPDFLPGIGEGIPDSRFGRNRESGNPPFPDLAGNRETGSRLAANREIRDTRLCEYIMHDPGLDVFLSPSNADSGLPPHFSTAYTEMADYGTDFSDDVDRNFDAKARSQQVSTVEIRSRRSFAGVKLRLYLTLNLTLALALALALSLVEECASPPDAS